MIIQRSLDFIFLVWSFYSISLGASVLMLKLALFIWDVTLVQALHHTYTVKLDINAELGNVAINLASVVTS